MLGKTKKERIINGIWIAIIITFLIAFLAQPGILECLGYLGQILILLIFSPFIIFVAAWVYKAIVFSEVLSGLRNNKK